MEQSYTITAKLWLYRGEKSQWHFLTIPKSISQKIRILPTPKRGWGSVGVKAQLNDTVWDTSIFPDSRSQTYMLPLKASVRTQTGVYVDDVVTIKITLV